MAELYQLQVVLCGVSPLVWRRLLISTKSSNLRFDWSGGVRLYDVLLFDLRLHGLDGTTLAFGYVAPLGNGDDDRIVLCLLIRNSGFLIWREA